MRYKYILVVVACFFYTVSLPAQNLSDINYESFEDLIEEIISATDMQVDYTTLFEELHIYYEDPLNLNTASHNQLKKLYILSDFQIQCLLDYIKEKGSIVSLYELNYIYGFSWKEIRFLIPFVTADPVRPVGTARLKDIRKYGRHEIIMRTQRVLEKQKGYISVSDSVLQANPNTSRYLGDPFKIYARYKYSLKERIYAGLTIEKDAGEEFFTGSNRYNFDFGSAYLQLRDFSVFKKIHIGDYLLRFGQGLTLWNGLAFGKSSYVNSIRKREERIKRFTSSDENILFRGAAGTVSLGDFNLSLFYSRKNRDANIIDTIRQGFYEFSSFQNTGYHRTPAENYDEKAIRESMYGANIQLKKAYWSLGATLVHYKFGGELHKSERVYNQFDFAGSEITNAGIDYHTNIGKMNFFGETTYGNDAWGMIHGTTIYINSLISFSAFYRMYQKGFYTHYGNALSENSSNTNEQGFYLGTEIHPLRYWRISAYADLYKFPWLKYNVSAPSTGADYFVQLDYTPKNNFEAYIRIKNEKGYENNTAEDTLMNKPVEISKFRMRLHFSYSLSNNFQLRSRLELNNIDKINDTPDKGYLLYQDMVYKFQKLPATIYFRYAIFDTDSYYSRIYAYENDLLYSYAIPPLYYRGVRSYIMIKYSVSQEIDLWLKYGRTSYSDRDSIGSGLNEINGNTKSEVKAQVRMRF
ncbi:MAG: helix-hairpin-helix domain-containing protein [Bacteroidales bacterium]|nr:MAG: helix-hairpin-helix domain-containing protein [Bacteroidales bacterium]